MGYHYNEIMQNFRFLLRLLHTRIEIWCFNLPYFHILGQNHCEGKRHDMFLSLHNNYNFKFTRDYEERCHVKK